MDTTDLPGGGTRRHLPVVSRPLRRLPGQIAVMATDPPSGRFQRFEQTRDKIGSAKAVARLERWSSPHTHPGTSAVRVTVTKIRVLAMFLIRRLAQGRGRRSALRRVRALAGSARGKTILVVGSGPSAERLSGKAVSTAQASGGIQIVATNRFLSSDLAQSFQPDFLLWSDDTFNPDRSDHDQHAWEVLTRHPGVTLVCPWTWRKTVESQGRTHNVVYFDDDSLEGWSRNISPMRPRGYQGTTGVKALAFATHLGPRKIQLIGLDLSYFRSVTVDSGNSITRHPTHLARTDSGQQNLNPATLLGMADLLYSTASQFRALHTHFRGFPIENLDPDSLIDAFPKVPSSELVRRR